MKNEDYILFEAYLSNELSKDEVAAFESRLKTEPEFNQAFTTYQELSSFLEHKFENEDATTAFQNNLKTISNAYFEKQVKPKKVIQFKPWQYAMAASVALLIGIFMFNNFSNPSFSDYNDYETVSFTVRGEQDELFKTAEIAFNNKDFAKAEEAFKQLIEEDENNAELKLYSGISNVELNNFETADKLLADLGLGNSAYKNKATWYLALSKLKQKNEAACLEILKTIPEDADDYEQAQKLIKKLD
jgi:tetratricopeptide (TPR) repeat protein